MEKITITKYIMRSEDLISLIEALPWFEIRDSKDGKGKVVTFKEDPEMWTYITVEDNERSREESWNHLKWIIDLLDTNQEPKQ